MFIFTSQKNKPLPKLIKNKNVMAATLEIRYDPHSIPPGVLIGALYNSTHFNKNYKMPVQTAIASIPSAIRQNDPNFASAIEFVLEDKKAHFQVGAGLGVLGLFVSNFSYTNWEETLAEFAKVLDVVNTYLPKEKQRIGVRFINFFPDKELSQFLNIQFDIVKNSILSNDFNMTLENSIDDTTKMKLTLSNTARCVKMNEQNGTPETLNGFAIDIDIMSIGSFISIDSIKETLDKNHIFVKQAFFGLFKQDYVKKHLQPDDEN